MTPDTARLFVGLELNEEARCALGGVRRALETDGVIGKFHDASLYHLTLCFLGNIPIDDILRTEQAISSVSAAPFSLTISDLGTFKNGSILWAGVKECAALMDYQQRLSDALRNAGVALEKGEYTPHITLARQVKSAVPEVTVPEVEIPVGHAALFHSTRIDGILTYLSIYRSVFH